MSHQGHQALEELLKQEEELLRFKENELQARREAVALRLQRKHPPRPEDPRLKELEEWQARERELQEALKEAPFLRSDHKEGQWLARITALQEELKQKSEKVKALRAKEQELEAELRTRLYQDSDLLPVLRWAASELVQAFQDVGGEASVGPCQVQGLQAEPVAAGPAQVAATVASAVPAQTLPAPTRAQRASVEVPPLPACLAHRVATVEGSTTIPVAIAGAASATQSASATPPGSGSRAARTPPSSHRGSVGLPGEQSTEQRWTTPVRRLDASLPAEDYCSFCGASLPSDALYCGHCGRKGDAAALQTMPARPSTQAHTPPPRPGVAPPRTHCAAGAPVTTMPTWSSPPWTGAAEARRLTPPAAVAAPLGLLGAAPLGAAPAIVAGSVPARMSMPAGFQLQTVPPMPGQGFPYA